MGLKIRKINANHNKNAKLRAKIKKKKNTPRKKKKKNKKRKKGEKKKKKQEKNKRKNKEKEAGQTITFRTKPFEKNKTYTIIVPKNRNISQQTDVFRCHETQSQQTILSHPRAR